MSKKRRKKYAGLTVNRPAAYVEPAQVSRGTAERPSKQPGEFRPDYSYVVRDLKRIAILAGSFLAILIVLSFFLR